MCPPPGAVAFSLLVGGFNARKFRVPGLSSRVNLGSANRVSEGTGTVRIGFEILTFEFPVSDYQGRRPLRTDARLQWKLVPLEAQPIDLIMNRRFIAP